MPARFISRRVPLPAEADLVRHSFRRLASLGSWEGYNTRVLECKLACELLGVSKLRDVGEADLRGLPNYRSRLNAALDMSLPKTYVSSRLFWQ